MHRKYRATHSASLCFGYVHALVSFTRTAAAPLADTAGVAAQEVSCALPHRRPVCRLDQGFTTGLQARTPKRRRGRHEQTSLAPTRLPAGKAATVDGSCRHPPPPPRVASRMQAGAEYKAAMAVIGASMAPKSGQQCGCSEGDKLWVTPLPLRTLTTTLSTEHWQRRAVVRISHVRPLRLASTGFRRLPRR
ncbi:hypothetical protein HPB50_021873 [Hyalomma asiaticum]|uniref:Uncharacterized protein n=1 Tax=Hyalomma asiaticum TaxID=266040 RepID=A0ACB7T150_HYAAI|nr:hypothetical protein HPB50_021873 [Hyalomma asiaticum]